MHVQLFETAEQKTSHELVRVITVVQCDTCALAYNCQLCIQTASFASFGLKMRVYASFASSCSPLVVYSKLILVM